MRSRVIRTQPITEPVEYIPEYAYAKGVVAGTKKLNLRVGPSMQSEVLCVLTEGTTLEYEKSVGDWCHVRSGSFDGYCMAKYIQ